MQTLDEVCCIHPASVLLSPNATVLEVRQKNIIIVSDVVAACYTLNHPVGSRGDWEG